MKDYRIEIERLTEEAESLEFGAAKIALLEEAVRLADAHGDVQIGFDTRVELATPAMFCGRPDLAIVTITWCMSQHDRDATLGDEADLLFKCKWVVSSLPEFPEISRQQIMAMFDDLERRFAAAGSTMHGLLELKASAFEDMGDRQAMDDAVAQKKRLTRDFLSDCLACGVDHDVSYLVGNEQDEKALAKAAPILSGQMACMEVPWRTYSRLLLPLLRLERAPQAMGYHQKFHRKLAANPRWIPWTAQHLTFLTLTRNEARGIRLLERHLPVALTLPSVLNRFHFLLASSFLLDRLLEQNKKALKLRLPRSFPQCDPQDSYDVAELKRWLDEQVRELADQFDARNGNDTFKGRIAGLEKLKELTTPCLLSARG